MLAAVDDDGDRKVDVLYHYEERKRCKNKRCRSKKLLAPYLYAGAAA